MVSGASVRVSTCISQARPNRVLDAPEDLLSLGVSHWLYHKYTVAFVCAAPELRYMCVYDNTYKFAYVHV